MNLAFSTLTTTHVLFMVGALLLCGLTYILGFFVAGKINDSINDELMSAFTLWGGFIVLGMTGLILHLVLMIATGIFLLSVLLPAILFLAAVIYMIDMIYDLSPIRSFFFLVIAFLIHGSIMVITFFGINSVAPTLITDFGTLLNPASQEGGMMPTGKMSYEEYLRRGGTPYEEGLPMEPFSDVPVMDDSSSIPSDSSEPLTTDSPDVINTIEPSTEQEEETDAVLPENSESSKTPSLPKE